MKEESGKESVDRSDVLEYPTAKHKILVTVDTRNSENPKQRKSIEIRSYVRYLYDGMVLTAESGRTTKRKEKKARNNGKKRRESIDII